MKNLENFFISQFGGRYIGDDGALLPSGEVVASDLFVEGVHFLPHWFRSLEDVGRKGALVNLSDIYVMGAEPKYAILGVGFPKKIGKRGAEALARGLKRELESRGVEIVGGDTISHRTILISITLIGKVWGRRPLTRRLKKEWRIGITGKVGRVGWELRRALRGGRLSPKSPFYRPHLPEKFLRRGYRLLGGAIDVSDGVGAELERLSHLNRVGVKLFGKWKRMELCSGEEYQVIFTFRPREWVGLKRRAKVARVKIAQIGKGVRGKYRSRCRPHHF